MTAKPLDPNRPTVPEIAPLVAWFRDQPGNGVGGVLHCVLDDGNLRDCDVRWSMEAALERGDLAGFFLAWILLGMSQKQRIALCGGFYDFPPAPTYMEDQK